MKTSQCERILRHLNVYGTITSHEAMEEYGIYRLASRISDLKKQGYPIKSTLKKGSNKFGEPTTYSEYSLVINE